MIRGAVGKVMWVGRSRSLTFALALVVAAVLAAGVLAMVGTKPAEAAFPGSNGKIAFASDRETPDNPIPPGQTSPDYEIFAMNPDGTGIEQLTFNTADDFYPAWSDNGGWIAWTNDEDGDSEIYMRSYGGGGFFIVRRLTNNTADDRKPVFAPDGSNTIAFASDRDGNGEIYVMNTSDTDGDGNADTQTNLTNNAAGDDTEPAWSPLLADGTTKIAFRTNRDSNNHEIYVMDTDGTNQTHLTNNTVADDEPDWSPDGSKIAFSSNRNGGQHDIYVMDAKDEINNVTGNPGPDGNGDNLKRRTKKAAGDYEPAWSPNGKKIAFKSDRGGDDSEIYVMKANKPESKRNRPKNLTKNGNVVGDFWPDWQPIPPPP